MATTLDTLEADVYDILNTNSSDDAYPSDFIDELLNQKQDEVCRKYAFPFLRKKMLFNTIIDTTLDGSVSTTDTTINLTSATSYDNNSAIYVEEDIITYTGVSSNQLTGVSNISVSHNDSADVSPLYSLPSDFARAEQFLVDSVVYEYVDDSDDTEISSWWTIEIDSNQNEYIRIPTTSSSVIAVLKYYKKAATMDSSTNATIPDEFVRKILPKLVAGEAKLQRDEADEGLALLSQGEAEILKMLKYYDIKNKTFRYKIKSKHYHNTFNI